MLSGCLISKDAADSLSSPYSNALPTLPATEDYSNCTTQVVDTGQKGSVAAVARGNYSDTKNDSLTSYPATVFADQSALSIKLTYWNGSRFVREVVSGDGNGSFVRLAFLSTGIPIVLWTLGTNVKASIRSAPLGTNGTWNSAIIDTGTAPRALEVSVNPLDQVSVVYISDTNVAGRPKFLYCDAPCGSPSNFQIMAPNSYIENTAVNAAETSVGTAWCKVSGSAYYPAAVYSVTGAVKYAVCRQTNLANCANSSNWTSSTVVSAGNLSSKLLIDSSVTGDVAKVITSGAGGITPYRMGALLCTSAPGAFSAGAAMGTSSSGTQWMSLMQDGSGKFHIVANEGTTSVKYFNSTSNDIISTWNAPGTVDTIALAAAHAGGAKSLEQFSLFIIRGKCNAVRSQTRSR